MAVPKRRTSKQHIRSRKATHRRPVIATQKCAKCGATHRPHHVCPSCGHYRGRQILTVESD